MALKTSLIYSPNFYPIKRKKNKIKFIVFHYTGMKKESAAIKRLTNIQSEVSSHYLIKKNGEIVTIVPELYVAWHAGKSLWKNHNSLNKSSIGIEISNQGHQFTYRKFSKKQINAVLRLSKLLIKKYNIDLKNILGHSDIALDRKKDPGEKFPWKFFAKNRIGIWHSLEQKTLNKNRMVKIDRIYKINFLKNVFKIGYSKKVPKKINKDKYFSLVARAFQRRYRQELVDGKIDRECLLISESLLKKYN
jgi:N-acetylmuramoyl-L-alanine amidase